MSDLPSLTGREFSRLLRSDNWVDDGKKNHGLGMTKVINGRRKLVVVPQRPGSLPTGTLPCIIGPKTNGSRDGGLEAPD